MWHNYNFNHKQVKSYKEHHVLDMSDDHQTQKRDRLRCLEKNVDKLKLMRLLHYFTRSTVKYDFEMASLLNNFNTACI